MVLNQINSLSSLLQRKCSPQRCDGHKCSWRKNDRPNNGAQLLLGNSLRGTLVGVIAVGVIASIALRGASLPRRGSDLRFSSVDVLGTTGLENTHLGHSLARRFCSFRLDFGVVVAVAVAVARLRGDVVSAFSLVFLQSAFDLCLETHPSQFSSLLVQTGSLADDVPVDLREMKSSQSCPRGRHLEG